MAKNRWEEPRIVNTDHLPEGLGHCREGGTESEFACTFGYNTAGETGEGPHRCATGGIAGPDYGGCAFGKAPSGFFDT